MDMDENELRKTISHWLKEADRKTLTMIFLFLQGFRAQKGGQ